MALGVVDFREATGSHDLSRRPRASWWQRLLDGVQTICVRRRRPETNFQRWAQWFRRASAPALVSMAKATRKTVGELCEHFASGVSPWSDAEYRPVVWQSKQHFLAAPLP